MVDDRIRAARIAGLVLVALSIVGLILWPYGLNEDGPFPYFRAAMLSFGLMVPLGAEVARGTRLFALLACLYLAMAGTTVFASLCFPAWSHLAGLETRIKLRLGLRQTDVIEGHIAFWIVAIPMTLVLWWMLRRRGKLLEIGTGFALLLAVPLVMELRPAYRELQWPLWELLGLAAALAPVLLVKKQSPWRLLFLVPAAVYLAWRCVWGGGDYAGLFSSAGPITAFLTAATWGINLSQRRWRRDSTT